MKKPTPPYTMMAIRGQQYFSLALIFWATFFCPNGASASTGESKILGNFFQGASNLAATVSQAVQGEKWSSILNAEGIIPAELDVPIPFLQNLGGLAQMTSTMLTSTIDLAVQQLDHLIQSAPQVREQIYSNFLKVHAQELTPDAADPATRPAREMQFVKNLKEMLRHNLAAKAGKTTWTQGVNRFTHMSSEEFLSKFTSSYDGLLNQTGASVSSLISSLPFTKSAGVSRAATPASIDWRQLNMVSSVKNQDICGSCYAFGALGCLESAYARLLNIRFYDLSEQEIVDCSAPYGNKGCGGGFPYRVYDYINDNGINQEAHYMYKRNSNTNLTCKANTGKAKVARKIKYQRYFHKDENLLAQQVATNGPATVIISSINWERYNSGVFSDGDGVFTRGCGNDPYSTENKNHLVLVVGYTPDYWIIKNSWGTDWGVGGYIKLKRGTNLCGVADFSEVILALE